MPPLLSADKHRQVIAYLKKKKKNSNIFEKKAKNMKKKQKTAVKRCALCV